MTRWFSAFLALHLLLLVGCRQTTHSTRPVQADQPTPWSTIRAQLDQPGPIELSRVVAADWKVPRSGLVNLDHPRAQGLSDDLEKIQIYFYVLEHPTRGTFLIDTGVSEVYEKRGDDLPLRFPITHFIEWEHLQIRTTTAEHLSNSRQALSGVLLTHLHLDHIMGLSDIPRDTPIFVGPGEPKDQRITHLFMRPSTDLNLAGFGPLRELTVTESKSAPLPYVDIFGDASLIGLHVPGHTRGSMAFIVRSPEGPHLVVGDACHTSFGWRHGVEPGTFNTDGEQAARSLTQLKALALAHPALRVHLGHQKL